MDEFEAQTLNYMRRYEMLQTGDTVIAALSGGADSVALFRVLAAAAPRLGICLRAAHVNHGMRGAQADADEAFVRDLCRKLEIALDVEHLAAPQKASEEWAREKRYSFFERISAEHSAKIVTAHTANDNAETVLFRLARGTAVRGAAGIPPVRGVFCRPILWAERKDVLAYLERCGQNYVTDQTNETDAYARNRIRHGALPSLAAAHEGAVRNIAHFAAEMADVNAFLDSQAQSLLKQAEAKPKLPSAAAVQRYDAQMIAQAPCAVQKAALRMLIAQAAVQQKTSLVPNAQKLLYQKNGVLPLGKGVCLAVRQGLLGIEREAAKSAEPWEHPMKSGYFQAPDGLFYKVSLINYEKNMNYAKDARKHLNFYADYAKMQGYPIFRTRKAKDRYRPMGRGISKTLKDFFTEQKVPQQIRDKVPVLAAGHEILWIAGFGFAQGYAPDDATKIAVTIQPQQTEE